MRIQTPLHKQRIAGKEVWLKREDLNPYGSHKAYGVINYRDWLRRSGWLKKKGRRVLIVSSSGRFVEAFAKATRKDNVEIVLVTDVLSSPALVAGLARYPHVTVDLPLINEPNRTGSHLPARLRRVEELRRQIPGALFVDQYTDPLLPEGYRKHLGPQLTRQSRGDIGAVFVPVGTGGLANGLVRYRRQTGGSWPIFAVDAEGSALLRTPPRGARRRLPGYGNAIRTALMREVLPQVEKVWVADKEAVAACHELRAKGVIVGPSSGATAAAFAQVFGRSRRPLPSGRVILLLPDSGHDYASTLWNTKWLRRNGFMPSATSSRRRS
jgi:cysteine synthase